LIIKNIIFFLEINQSTDIRDYSLDDLVIYELSLVGNEDKEQHSKIYGSNKGYCINSSCKFKGLRCKK